MKRESRCKFSIRDEKKIIKAYSTIQNITLTAKKFNCSKTCIRNILIVYDVRICPIAEVLSKDSIDCFWEKVDIKKDDECWNWTGALDGNGKNYGRLQYYGRSEGAHRISWEIHNGIIPLNLHVLHSCDNRKCVNPSHLFLGTQSDNVQDMLIKGRNRNQHTIKTKGVVL